MELLPFGNKLFDYVTSRNGSNMIFLRIHRDPPWPLSVTYSILTKQCISFNPTRLYLNIPLDQTHPFLKGFYLISISVDAGWPFKTNQWIEILWGGSKLPRCSVILPGYWKIPGYLTKNTRVFFSTPDLLTNTRVFSIKYPGIWQPVKYPGKWQLMTAETTCGLFRRISGVLRVVEWVALIRFLCVIINQQ